MGKDLSINSIYGGGKATQEADNVLLLQETEISGPITGKSIEVVKNRYAGYRDRLPYIFNKDLTFTFKEKRGAAKKIVDDHDE